MVSDFVDIQPKPYPANDDPNDTSGSNIYK